MRTMFRAVRLRGTSSANFDQSCRLSATWQPVQFNPRAAEKNPIVSINSLTGIPFNTCTLLNTFSSDGTHRSSRIPDHPATDIFSGGMKAQTFTLLFHGLV